MNDVDITKMVAPKTDQLNADDFIGQGDRAVTITGVKQMDSAEQPLAISYDGDKGKPWKPNLGMRRVLIQIWGDDEAKAANKYYVGRTVVLFRDPNVKFGKDLVGGIRVRAASHIDGERKVSLTVSKGKRIEFVVKPYKAAPQEQMMSVEEFEELKKEVFSCLDLDALKVVVGKISANSHRMIRAYKDALNAEYKATKAAIEGNVA